MRKVLSMIEAHGEIELRCPDCASPEVETSLPNADSEREMGCANCGAQFALGSTFISLADCETLIGVTDDGSSLAPRHRGDRR